MANTVFRKIKADGLTSEIKIQEESSGSIQNSRLYGNYYPYLEINGYEFHSGDILQFEIDTMGKIPKLKAVLIDNKKFFSVSSMPRDGDIAATRIMSRQEDTYRDIRIDFDLNSVKIKKVNQEYIINVLGEARIPGIYADDAKGYPNQSSIKHLEQIATELNLGFVSNIEESNDNMVHFLANENRFSLIDRIVEHSYHKEGGFQDWKIDAYSNLNFIDFEEILNSEKKIEDTLINLKYNPNFILANDVEDLGNNINAKLLLSNSRVLEGSNLYISNYRIINNSARVVRNNGYRTVVKYFENDTQSNLIEFEVNPNVTQDLDELEEGLGKRDNEERFKIENKYKYLGRQDDGLEHSNVHVNYLYTNQVIQQNRSELDKIKLEVELDAFNPALHLFQYIPIVIYVANEAEIAALQYREEKIEKAALNENVKKISETSALDFTYVLEPTLTGFYIIMGIKYIYDINKGFSQRLLLARREWPAI